MLNYTGKELDSSTGLYYYGARYYNPLFGRFTQADSIVQAPYDPQSLNRYAYTRNNPLRYTDPTGQSWEDVWETTKQSWEWNYNLMQSTISNLNTSIIQPTVSIIGTSLAHEARVWGSALGMGMEYGLGEMGKDSNLAISKMSQSIEQIDQGINKFSSDIKPDPGFGQRFWRQFYRDRPGITSWFSFIPLPIPKGLIVLGGIEAGKRTAQSLIAKEATRKYTSFSTTRSFVYMKGYRPKYFTYANRLGQTALFAGVVATAIDLGIAVESAIYTWKNNDN